VALGKAPVSGSDYLFIQYGLVPHGLGQTEELPLVPKVSVQKLPLACG